jgi:hypothetical protein
MMMTMMVVMMTFTFELAAASVREGDPEKDEDRASKVGDDLQ